MYAGRVVTLLSHHLVRILSTPTIRHFADTLGGDPVDDLIVPDISVLVTVIPQSQMVDRGHSKLPSINSTHSCASSAEAKTSKSLLVNI